MVPWPRVVIISPWEVLARRLVSPVPWDSHTTCQSSALHYEPNARDMSSSMVNCIIPNTGGPILQNACGSCILYFTHLHSTSSWRTHTHSSSYFTLDFDSPKKKQQRLSVCVQTAQSYDLSEVLRCFFCLKTNCRWLRWARVKMQPLKNRGLCGWLQIS